MALKFSKADVEAAYEATRDKDVNIHGFGYDGPLSGISKKVAEKLVKSGDGNIREKAQKQNTALAAVK